jgi:hypothetical protein
MKALFPLFVCYALLCGCSPYSGQMKQLDADYRAGRIPPRDYYALRNQMMEGDANWRAQVSANLNQVSANLNQQNAVNAYNARTNVYAQPQQVNVNHSGTVNQNVSGTIYHRY